MIAPANFGEVSGIWISESGFNPASGFQHLDFWFQFSFLVPVFSPACPNPDEILRSDLVLIDRIRPIEKKNPVADFQQQV